jgi:ABC-type transporter Mla MlaB component
VVVGVPEQSPIILSLGGPIARSELPGMHDSLRERLECSAGSQVICDISELAADAQSVDALARLHLTAHRCGCELTLCNASLELRRLLEFVGLEFLLRRS